MLLKSHNDLLFFKEVVVVFQWNIQTVGTKLLYYQTSFLFLMYRLVCNCSEKVFEKRLLTHNSLIEQKYLEIREKEFKV